MAAESRMVTADGSFNALLTEPDPQHPGLGCAAWWPRESGWQALQAGDDEWLVFVRPRADLPVLQAAERSSATLALVNESTSAAAMLAQSVWQRGWWMLAWLLLAAGLWWLEREDLPRA